MTTAIENFSLPEAKYVDGVKMLHAQLDIACKKAYEISAQFISLSTEASTLVDNRTFFIFVDFCEQQPENAIRGYFVFDKKIVRFANIVLDYAVFFPYSDHSYSHNTKNNEGISIADILKLRNSNVKIIIKLSPNKDSRIDFPLYVFEYKIISESINDFDDIGLPYSSFTDIDSLKLIDTPDQFRKTIYPLVGKKYYAPFTKSAEIYCVLFAQLDNEHDEKAVKVLRWIPNNRSQSIKERNLKQNAKLLIENRQKLQERIQRLEKSRQRFGITARSLANIQNLKSQIHKLDKDIVEANTHGDVFFELGYVSKSSNRDLHDFMTRNSSRLLFGRIKDDKISLMGGIKIFFEKDFNYPACLIKIPVK